MSQINFQQWPKVILLSLLLSLSGCGKSLRDQFPPEEKRYYIQVLIGPDMTKSYKCDKETTINGSSYATDCEDNDGHQIGRIIYSQYLVEITDRQKEIY